MYATTAIDTTPKTKYLILSLVSNQSITSAQIPKEIEIERRVIPTEITKPRTISESIYFDVKFLITSTRVLFC